MIDLKRPRSIGVVLLPLMAVPAAVAVMVRPTLRHVLRDGVISVLRAYSRSTLVALGTAADPLMRIEELPSSSRFGPGPAAMVFSRHGARSAGVERTEATSAPRS